MTNPIRAAAAALALLAAPAGALAQDSITIGMQLEPPHLDPTSAAAAAIDEVVYANVYEGLTRFAADGSVRPALAERWEIADDALSYTFHLREGVTFHDGAMFTAEDVKFSLDRARAEDSTNAQKQLFAAIDSVNVIDELTVEVTLTRPEGALLFNLAWGDVIIVNESDVGSLTTRPVGTGPFRFDEWVQGDRVELVRFDDYWGEPVALQAATFKFISDPTAAFAAMMAGDIDAFPVFPAPENLAQFEADPRFKVLVGTTEGETILATNNAAEPFDDVRVRQALAMAIDRQAVIDGAMFGYGTPIGTHFAPHHPAYLDLTGLSPHDPEAARAMLAEAGYPDGFETTLKLPPPSYARRGGEIIAAQLRQVGIDAEIQNLEWAQWLEQVFRGKDYGLTIVSHTEPLDIGIYARPDYYFNYDDAAMQALDTGLAAMTDPQDRADVLRAMQTRIGEQYVNGYLFQLAKTGVARTGVEGLWVNSPTQANDLTGVRWAE